VGRRIRAVRNIIDNSQALGELTPTGVRREFPFPKSTFEELVAANPKLKEDGVTKDNVLTEEVVGPWQVLGSRLWFGREFYASEGAVGVGAFGYFDTSTRTFKLYSPPELRHASVFALRIEGNIAWLALGRKGEWGDSGDGLLRVDLQTMRTRKFAIPGMATTIVRPGDQLYVGTSEGVSVMRPNGQIENYFIDISKTRSYRLSLARPPR
jgi:hypothetical protein